jgi:glycosyltransferase involved in cell wall biosynthesis
MKILIFNWRDIKNPEAGGAEVFTHEIAKRLVGKGNEVTLFTSEFDGCKKKEVIDGVRLARDGRRYSVYSRARKYYREYLSGERFDVIIDEINTKPFFAHEFANKGEKIIALIHQLAKEYWFYETPFPLNILGYYFLERRWLRRYTDLPTVTVSESTRKDLVDIGLKRVFVVPEGLGFEPLSRSPEKEKDPTVVYLGRLNKAKRPYQAVKAFEMVEKEVPNAKLWIVGDGYLRRELERHSSPRVEFFGHVSNGEKINLLSKAWITVNPSVREGWGLNVIEANACGTPCIAYDVPGLRDSIVDGKTGLLVKGKGGVKKLAETMIRALQNDILRKELSDNALEYSKKFSWDRSAEEFLRVIEYVASTDQNRCVRRSDKHVQRILAQEDHFRKNR